ncbi:histidine phosphatase family protein [Candidatus Woesearchaeota archaeon]|nr:histidine phosphatase family protein [Candidatus Woesearchaeota archaeon]
MDRTIVNVRRHSIPDKDPETGKSLDSLTEEGKQQARDLGASLYKTDSGIILVGYHSPKERAKETVEYIFDGAGAKDAQVSIDDRLNMTISPEHIKAALVTPEGEKRAYSDVVQYLMDNADPTGKTFAEYGQVIVDQLRDVVNDQNAIQQDKVYIEDISHGPLVEAALLTLLGTAGKNVQDIRDIGGGFAPLEGFAVQVDYKESGIYAVELQCRDIVVPIDF